MQPGPSVEHLAERQRMEEAAMPLMLDAMWAANVLDIEGTLRAVCRKVSPWPEKADSCSCPSCWTSCGPLIYWTLKAPFAHFVER